MNSSSMFLQKHNRSIRLSVAVLMLCGALVPIPASASLSMSVSTNEASDFLLLDAPGALILHGDAVGGTAHVLPGGHPCLPGIGPNCLTDVIPPFGFAQAEMDAGAGHFQLYAGESGGGSGSVGMMMTDSISRTGLLGVGTVTFDVHIDLSLHATLDHLAGAAAYSDFNYSILTRSCDGNICDYNQVLFSFDATRQSTRDAENNITNYSNYGWSDIMGGGDSGSAIPGVFETSFSMPVIFGSGAQPFDFAISISGGGACDFGDNCGSAYVSSVNSAYLGIRVDGGYDYTSANGYAYPGFAPAVPVPAAIWLFGSGLVGMIGIARRKRNQANAQPERNSFSPTARNGAETRSQARR